MPIAGRCKTTLGRFLSTPVTTPVRIPGFAHRRAGGWQRGSGYSRFHARFYARCGFSQDYIRTARSKGLQEQRIWLRHGMRNAFIPIATFLGPSITFLLVSSAIIEQVFAWPGVGRLLVQAPGRRDYPIVMIVVIYGSQSPTSWATCCPISFMRCSTRAFVSIESIVGGRDRGGLRHASIQAQCGAKAKEKEKRPASRSLTQKALRTIWRDKLTLAALAYLVGMTIIALLAPTITDYLMQVDPNEPVTADKFTPPFTDGYILGADDIGRDQLARLLHASGVSMGIGFFSAVLSLCIGVILGMVAGFRGGIIDDALNWFVTTFDAIPLLFILILIASFVSFNSTTLIFVFGFFTWPSIYRLIRGEAISLRHREYIIAATALGAGTSRIIFAHILPNLVSITAIVLMRGIAGFILAESGLSYLGYGVQPPQATWGNMLTKSLQFYRLGPHLIIFPILMISVTVLCFYIIGDGIRDAFDPTLQR